MVLSFALCASLAFAQTAKVSKGSVKLNRMENAAVKLSDLKASVDYKASIFTKDAESDTAAFYDFHEASQVTVGTITTGDAVHNQSGVTSQWMHWADSATCAAQATENFPRSGDYIKSSVLSSMGATNNGSDNGFYMLVYDSRLGTGVYNTYIEFPAVTRNENAVIIDVRFNQWYYNYYDQCFIDYKVGNNWKSVEINIDGVDCDINGFAAYQVSYVMPQELINQPSIQIRLRGLSEGRSGSDYGYSWAVDNVAICNVYTESRWRLTSAHAYEGFYGQIPQGMGLPLSYAVNARNTGITDLSNAKLILNTGTERNVLSPAFEGVTTNIPQGDVNRAYNLVFNERGFMLADNTNLDHGNQGTFYDKENYGQASNAGFQGRTLPVSTTGKNFYNIVANSGSLSTVFDTVAYNVTGLDEGENKVPGYRWSRDNGVIPSNSVFSYQLNRGGYVTDEDTVSPSDPLESNENYMKEGYSVTVRYVSGSDVPEGWVFRGLEIIPATKKRFVNNMTGAQISPLVQREAEFRYDEAERSFSWSYYNMNVGLENQAITVSSNAANADLANYGVIAPGESYNSVQIQFYDQPAIEPNTAYRFGYRMENDAFFAAASQSYRTVTIDDTGARWWTPYSRVPEVADYARQVYPNNWQDVIVTDKAAGDGKHILATNIDEYPLIRPIVGPKQELPSVNIAMHFSPDYNDTGVLMVHSNDRYTHDDVFQAAVGSTQALVIHGGNDHRVLDSLYINGQKVEPYDQRTEQGDPNFITYDDNVLNENENVRLYRKLYYYFFDLTNATPNSTINVEAFSHWQEWEGIEDVMASNVRMILAPNPATSQVKLSLEGVNGMVNCNIIDMSGRVVYNANLNAEKQQVLDLSNIATGAYFVRVTNDKFSKIEKLIIR